MVYSFLESIKFVGHILPISFLRIFLGYFYLQTAMDKFKGDYMTRPELADQIAQWLPLSHAPDWYKVLLNSQLIPHWKVFAFIILGLEFAIGISYLAGYLVRPIAILATILCVNLLFISGPNSEELLKTFIAIHICFAWLGAGRCLGVDYYFFKRRRGIWW